MAPSTSAGIPLAARALLLLICTCFDFAIAGTAVSLRPEYSSSSSPNLSTPSANHNAAPTTPTSYLQGSYVTLTPTASEVSRMLPSDPNPTRSHERPGAIPTAEAAPGSSEIMHAVEPFVLGGAIVSGPVGSKLQAALRHDPWAGHRDALPADDLTQVHGGAAHAYVSAVAAGGRRGLLHGSRPLWKYAICNRCTLVSCNSAKTSCSGHCKKNSKAFFCSRKNIPVAFCITPPGGIVRPATPDSLATYDTVIVTAPAPYVGCANIANRPTGCPAPFTGGTTADGNRITVVRSSCMAEGYTPECGSPYFPFGVCECRMIVSGVGIVTQPCNTSEVTLGVRSAPNGLPTKGLPSTSEDGVVVDSRGRITYTGFSDYTDADDEPRWQYNVTVAVARASGKNVTVFLDFFETEVIIADELTEESDISEDYDYGQFVP